MIRGSVPMAILAAGAILAAVGWGILAFLGTGVEVVRGLGLGYLLGAGGCAAEIVFVRRALERPLQQALRVVFAGLAIRIFVLLGGALGLMATGIADPSAYALAFLGGFFAFLPVLAAVTLGRQRNGEAKS